MYTMVEHHCKKEISNELAQLLPNQSEVVKQQYQHFYEWMVEKGRAPRKEDGLQTATAENYFDRLDQIHRVIILNLDPESKSEITPDEADEILHVLARDDITKDSSETYSESS